MSKQRSAIILVVGVTVVVVAVKIFLSISARPIDPALMRAKGDPKAKVQIIEFIDFQCPACAAGALKLKEYFAGHPDDIHVAMKYFPLIAAHKHAMTSSMYTECAARQGKFWALHDILVERQAQWSPLISAEGMFTQFAREAGMDEKALRSCLASGDLEQSIMQDRDLGRSLGVQSTPTYFINNKMVVGSKSLVDELDQYFPSSTKK